MTMALFVAGWLTAAGYGAPQRTAVAHHAFVESRMQPAAVSRGGRHVGMWQWAGPRKAGLFRYALSRGKSWTDTVTQLEWMDREARSIPGMRAFFAASTTREAILIFCRQFERRRAC